ncbi:NADPH2:quinone reductase [Strigomonas culicis]|nr:NADPH2:quinone reductase [Strigomonas culicis]|eukprot:EPY32063.1 NADPH2:quinone reductase [Strigomonas culicis]
MPQMPYTPGLEGAGAVVQVGSAAPASLLGQRVSYHGDSSGSYASFTIVAQDSLSRVPEGVSDADAAAVPCQAFTAHYLTHDSYVCGPGSVVVVQAAAGGTGLLICQMAKLRGATVIALCGGEAKAALAASVGRADHVIDYKAVHDWPAAVRQIAPEGVHAVYDGVGRDTFEGDLRVLRRRGTLVSFGNASGAVPPVAPLLLAGSIYLQRPKLNDYMVTAEEREKRAADVYGWIQKKQLQLTIGKIFPLSEAAQAHAYIEGRQSTGKLLLNCKE